jgi:hypothetical protein
VCILDGASLHTMYLQTSVNDVEKVSFLVTTIPRYFIHDPDTRSQPVGKAINSEYASH